MRCAACKLRTTRPAQMSSPRYSATCTTTKALRRPAAREHEQHTLCHQLPHEPRATCAEREPDRDLFAPFGRAGQQEIRKVDACEQKDETHDAHEHTGEADDRVAYFRDKQTRRR